MRCRRAIRTVFVYALLGAVATVLSSWAIHAAQFSRARAGVDPLWKWTITHETYHALPTLFIDNSEPPWPGHRVRTDGSRWVSRAQGGVLHRAHQHDWAWHVRYEQVLTMDERPGHAGGALEQLTLIRTGWPAPAMAVATYGGGFIDQHKNRTSAHTPALSLRGGVVAPMPGLPPMGSTLGFTVPADPLFRFALPLLPLWPGFLLNTCLYAVLTFALVRTPRVLRRAVRRRRGRCVGCGYDWAGLDAGAACPECGAGTIAR